MSTQRNETNANPLFRNPLLRNCPHCRETKYDKKFYYLDADKNAIAFKYNEKMICRGCAIKTGAWALAYEARSLITRRNFMLWRGAGAGDTF